MSVVQIIFRILLGAFFIVSGYLKLFPAEMLELSIAETGWFSWEQSIYLARLLIGFEFFIGVMLIAGVYKKLTWIVCISTLVLFTFYLSYMALCQPQIADCGCMGMQIQISPVSSIIKNLILIIICIGIWFFETRFPAKWINDYINNKLIVILGVVASVSLPFLLNPVEVDRETLLAQNPVYKNKVELSDDSFLTWHSKDTTYISGGKKLVCYFSPSCRFCRLMARKIMVFRKQLDVDFPVYFLFAGNPDAREKLEPFVSETKTESIPMAIIGKEEFFSVSGPNLPVVFYIDGDSIVDRDNFRTLSDERILTFFGIEK